MQILIVGSIFKGKGYAVPFQRAGAKLLGRAGCLDQALEVLAHYDGVVCAQSIPTHAGREGEPPETQSGNWAAVASDCHKLGKPFVLICATGSYRLSERFNQVAQKDMAAWPSFALLESVDAEWVADTICTAMKYCKRQESGIAERAGIDMLGEFDAA